MLHLLKAHFLSFELDRGLEKIEFHIIINDREGKEMRGLIYASEKTMAEKIMRTKASWIIRYEVKPLRLRY